MEHQTTEHLVPFLRKLADSIESKEVFSSTITEDREIFLCLINFKNKPLKDCQTDNETPPPPSPEELTKFLFMGWYVYQLLLRSESLNES